MKISFKMARNLGISAMIVIILTIGLHTFFSIRKIANELTMIIHKETEYDIADKIRKYVLDAHELLITLRRGEIADINLVNSLIDKALEETAELDRLVIPQAEGREVDGFVAAAQRFKTSIEAYVGELVRNPSGDTVKELEDEVIGAIKETRRTAHDMIQDMRNEIRRSCIEGLNTATSIQRVTMSVALIGILVGVSVAFLMGPTLSKPILTGIAQIVTAANNILFASQQEAIGIEQEVAQISEAAASAKELATTARQVNDIGNEIARSSASSVRMADAGVKVAEETVGGMEKIRRSVLDTAKKIETLGERSQAITEIVTLIEDIADQTNLLSLNAAIEAARAGEVGKGFAVVADSIGKLAERTTKSTKNINDLIRGVQQDTSSCVMSMEESTKETERGTLLAQEAGKHIKEILGAIEHVAQSAKEISLASQQQMSGSEQVSKAMAELDQIMRQSATSAKQGTETAKRLVTLADEFRKIIGVTESEKDT